MTSHPSRVPTRGGALLLLGILSLAVGQSPGEELIVDMLGASSGPEVVEAPRVAEDVRRAMDEWSRGKRSARTLTILDPDIAASMGRLSEGSRTFAAAVEALESSGTPILVGTREQLAELLPGHLREGTGWVGVTLNWGLDGILTRSVVALRLEWLERVHRGRGIPASDDSYDEALDHLVIHEIYGHLTPVVTVGKLGASCADPRPGERHADSCVGQRETEIRSELDSTRSMAGLAAPEVGVAAGGGNPSGSPVKTGWIRRLIFWPIARAVG